MIVRILGEGQWEVPDSAIADLNALDDATSLNRGDDIARELESMSSQSDVEAELAALRSGTGGRAAIDATGPAGAGLEGQQSREALETRTRLQGEA